MWYTLSIYLSVFLLILENKTVVIEITHNFSISALPCSQKGFMKKKIWYKKSINEKLSLLDEVNILNEVNT